MRLQDSIASPEGKRTYVRTLFATIADRYDLITVVLSYGQDRRWKRRLVDLTAPSRRALDLATGTGDIANLLAARGARVVGLDITLRMIELARAKRTAAAAFLVGDMLAIPFPAASFDLVTTGYGLRNVPDLPLAIDEIARVLEPGGALWSLDFTKPVNAVVRSVYLWYLGAVGGALGWALHRDADTYRYIPASLRMYPTASEMTQLLEARGFVNVRHYQVLGGLMAIHQAIKPHVPM